MRIIFRDTLTRPVHTIEAESMSEQAHFEPIEWIINRTWDQSSLYDNYYRRFVFEVGMGITLNRPTLEFVIEYHPLKGRAVVLTFGDKSPVNQAEPSPPISRFAREEVL